ncbi:MAG: tRNA (N(6)-L-threonylcarbamoyladenosine(37)-C(2))-methylthiotransferase MtaB [Dehalococcoidia bacterium]|nr:tRNA (N(6)-L-threonylcarbamoyladenosine(37)-C(2))-methylthiotransferase MtaB [Dehalococcoidia bacterium]
MPQNIRVAIDTLGCKLNYAESETLAHGLAQAGFCLVGPDEYPDIYVLNTCSVTHIADKKSRHLLRMAKRQNPKVFTVAVGCYSEIMSREAAIDLKVDLIVGNADKTRLPILLKEQCNLTENCRHSLLHSRTRAFVKVQEGCNRHCAYCVVPLVRGHEKSVPMEDVIATVRERVSEGYREVVLTGTEIGCYESSGLKLKDLLKSIMDASAIERIRVSSLQPHEINRELLDLWHDPRMCRHFHISLQSGADSVLKRMKRGYNVLRYKNALELINEKLSDAAVTSDVIVGFPAETEDEFRETIELCRSARFAKIHVFPFSLRRGTEAACMPDQISSATKKERMRQMLLLAKESRTNFEERLIGRKLAVLWEQARDGMLGGYSSQYIRVYARSDSLPNTLQEVIAVGLYKDGLLAEVV